MFTELWSKVNVEVTCWFLRRRKNRSSQEKKASQSGTETNKIYPYMALRPEWTPGNIGGKQMMSREGIDKIIGYLHDHGGVSLLTRRECCSWPLL